jgi:hypothetical protein
MIRLFFPVNDMNILGGIVIYGCYYQAFCAAMISLLA